jgi:predicted O-methyltransferase YrrM
VADKSFQIRSYLSYWLDAVDEHSLHSPFFFDFYRQVVKAKSNQQKQGIEAIEQLRQKLLADSRTVGGKDPGARTDTKPRTVSAIARASLSPAALSALYARIIHHFKAHTILELGTSFGINTLYLARQKDTAVTTFEGSPEIADIARITFSFAKAPNIKLIEGNLDTTLAVYLQSVRKVDFVLMDANHRYQPTLQYFERLLPKISETSIVVLDDIHYSSEMEQAWRELKKHSIVYGSADLFRCGILFFDPSLNKQHVILQY